jgi:RpiR family carbohydrate utilization transcriptional regulator|tara:strand:- start:81661 stop:82512 length:852 start_codon:yes stop_codon:yes gene_type:complete
MALNMTQLLDRLEGKTDKLSKSDVKIAAVVLRDPQAAIHQSIARLATEAEVSEPTVNRLCRKLGCNGYPDFKLKLAQEISRGSHMFSENMEASDDTRTVINKILSSIEQSVHSIGQATSPASIEEATDLLMSSKSIYFFGMGASGPVALDAQHKFARFGIPVVAHTDFINQRMMCSMLTKDDSAVFISYTGRTKAIVESAALATKSGARTIGLTRSGTPLAEHCRVVVNAVTAEDTDLFTPMTSRIIHLALVDILATKMALQLGDEVEKNIKAIKTNLQDTRS